MKQNAMQVRKGVQQVQIVHILSKSSNRQDLALFMANQVEEKQGWPFKKFWAMNFEVNETQNA